MNATLITSDTLTQPAPSPNEFAPIAPPKNAKLPDRLFSDRTYRIGSENAFRIGPQIRELERIRKAVTDVDGFQQFIQEGKHLC